MAHQDDEYGIFSQIEAELQAGKWVRCVYATHGGAAVICDQRERESRDVLHRLGVVTNDILFIGRQLSISDGQLYRHVRVWSDWLACFLNSDDRVEACYLPAWEGGHPDHDVLHAATLLLLTARKSPPTIYQYPLYNNWNCLGPFFRVLSPLPYNGQVVTRAIDWSSRFRYLWFCLSYHSQWRSWIGLFPFVAVHYLFRGDQYLQFANLNRIMELPHQRPLYYEIRGFLDWSVMRMTITQLKNNIPYIQ